MHSSSVTLCIPLCWAPPGTVGRLTAAVPAANAACCARPPALVPRRRLGQRRRDVPRRAWAGILLALRAALDEDGLRPAPEASAEIHGLSSRDFPLPLVHAELAPLDTAQSLWLRYCYEGGKLARDGRLVQLQIGDDVDDGCVSGNLVLQKLQAQGIDFESFAPHAYDQELTGWAPLLASTRVRLVPHGPRRIDITLFRTHRYQKTEIRLPDEAAANFSIGIMGGKVEKNLGTLWRSSYQMGASAVFVIGDRFRSASKNKQKDKMLRIKQSRGHVMSRDNTVPLLEFSDWYINVCIGMCVCVCVCARA